MDRSQRRRTRVGHRGRRKQRQYGGRAGRGVDRCPSRTRRQPHHCGDGRRVGDDRPVDRGLAVVAGGRGRSCCGDGHPHPRGRRTAGIEFASGRARGVPGVGRGDSAPQFRRASSRCRPATRGGDGERLRMVPGSPRPAHGGGSACVRLACRCGAVPRHVLHLWPGDRVVG